MKNRELASVESNNGESDGHAGLPRPVFTYYEHVCHAHAAFVPFSQPGGSPVVDLQTLMTHVEIAGVLATEYAGKRASLGGSAALIASMHAASRRVARSAAKSSRRCAGLSDLTTSGTPSCSSHASAMRLGERPRRAAHARTAGMLAMAAGMLVSGE